MGRHAGYSRSFNAESSFQVLVWCAFAGIVTWYLHAELYTVYGPFMKLRAWEPTPNWALLVQQMRWWVRGIAAICLLMLVVLETRWQVLSEIMHSLLRRRVGVGLVLMVLGLLSGVYFLLPGYVLSLIHI